MGSARTRPSAFENIQEHWSYFGRRETSNHVHACYVTYMVGISDCLHAPGNRVKSWRDEEPCALKGFHFSSDDIHSEQMLSRESQFHIQQNPPLIPMGFAERYLP